MKRSPWFPVWAGFQDDEPFLAVSAEAELLYLRGVARCKQLDQGADGGHLGRHQLRRLCDKMTGPPADLAAELCAAGLWVEVATGWAVPAYGEWNRSAEEDRHTRALNAKQGNHTRWKHTGKVDDCPICNKDETPGGSGSTPIGLRPDSDRSPKPSLDVDEIRLDETTPPGTDARHGAPPTADGPLVVRVVDSMLARLGYATAPPAGPDLRAYTAKALAQGWTAADLTELANEAGTRVDVFDALGWLRGGLKRLANEDPPPPTSNGYGYRQPDPPRPTLHDERPPCAPCGASGWVDHPDGGVVRCPECNTVRATA